MSLPEPRTPAGRAGLTALLAEPQRALVALDFDGTLSPIVPRPEDSRLADGALDVLHRLAALVGRIAVVTGRPAATAVELGGLAEVPGLVVVGQYGLEEWADGVLRTPEPLPGVAVVRDRLPHLLRDAPEGVRIEDKHHALVVHTRLAADPEGTLAALTPALRALAEEAGLDAASGRYVVELRPPGADKGGALRRLVAELRPGVVLFAGDDVGDLPAYDAVEALRATGVAGLTVCSASTEAVQVAERADLVVDGPPGLVALLTAVIEAIQA